MSGPGDTRGFSARFWEMLCHNWWKRLLVLAVAIGIGIVSSLLLGDRHLLQEANRTALTAVQKRLGDTERDTRAVTLVDLSTAIGHREQVPITPGETLPDGTVLPSQSQVDFHMQIEGLIELLDALGSYRPKAVLVDWQTTAPTALWDAEQEQWRGGVSQEFKDAYARLLATIDSLARTCQVFIAGDLVQDAVRARRKTAPGRRHDVALLASELPRTEWYPFFPLAPIQAGSGHRMPSVTDGLIAFHELEDRVQKHPSKWGLFEAVTVVNGRDHFWIDYGFAPSLVHEALYLNFSQWTDPNPPNQLSSRLSGKLVVVADLTRPLDEDAIPLPVRPEKLMVPLPGGGKAEIKGSGGIAHACAFLTRSQEPLYALPSGLREHAFFAALNVFIALVAWVLSALVGAIRRCPLDTRREVGLELLLLIGVTFSFAWFALDWMANMRIMVPQVEGFLITRSVDSILLVVFLWWKEPQPSGGTPMGA